jgi:thiamine-monophosphate kinase
MMDVSDGLLLDASRLASASKVAAHIDLAALPLSDAFIAVRGEDRMFAATGGDDYALLVALPETIDPFTLSLPASARVTAIGRLADGEGVALVDGDMPVSIPERLGHEHRGLQYPPVDHLAARPGVGHGDGGAPPLGRKPPC